MGNSFLEKAYNNQGAKKSVDEQLKTSDILFNEENTVIHLSGNKETTGKILKTS